MVDNCDGMCPHSSYGGSPGAGRCSGYRPPDCLTQSIRGCPMGNSWSLLPIERQSGKIHVLSRRVPASLHQMDIALACCVRRVVICECTWPDRSRVYSGGFVGASRVGIPLSCASIHLVVLDAVHIAAGLTAVAAIGEMARAIPVDMGWSVLNSGVGHHLPPSRASPSFCSALREALG